MSDTCETLVSVRKKYSPLLQRDIWIRLAGPEPCGVGGREYEITRVQASGLVVPPTGLFLVQDAGTVVQAPTVTLRQTLCDRHKKKAEREGMKVSEPGGRENTYE